MKALGGVIIIHMAVLMNILILLALWIIEQKLREKPLII